MSSPATSAASSSTAPRSAARRVFWHRVAMVPGLLAVVTFAVILGLWQAAADLFAIPPYLLPSPTRNVEGFGALPAWRWLDHIWSTLRIALAGFALSIAISLPISVALARSEIVSRALYPILVVIQSTPVVAIAPIIIVVMGAGDAPRIVITCLITFFPLVVATTTGLMATPTELIELSRSLKAPAVREITQIRLPFAIPYLFAALKISITPAVIGAVVAEFVAADKGVGYFIQFSTSMFRVPEAWTGLVILLVMSLALFQAVALTQRVVFPWSLSKGRS